MVSLLVHALYMNIVSAELCPIMYRVLSLYLENRELCSMTTTLQPRGCALYVSRLSAAPVARGCLEPPVQALPPRARAHMASFAVNDKCCRHHPGGGLRRFLACLQLLGLLLSLGGMDGNNNDGKQDSRPPPWSDEEIAARNAAAWEDECWTSPWTTTSLQNAWDDDRETGHATATAQLCSPVDPVASINQPQPGVTSTASSSSSWEPLMVVTSQTSSSSSWGSNGNGSSSSMQLAGISETLSAWDENLSLSLQEEEIHLVSSLGALGGALPLAPIPEEIPHPFGLPPLQETSAMASASQQLDANDLLAKLSDGRPLRGRPPAPLRGEAALPHARDPSSLATPKGNSPPKVGEIDWSSPGVTQRGSRTRPGIDRWHNLDGTIRYRLREEQSQARGPATSPPTDRPSDPSSIGSDLRPEATQHASSHTSFYDGKAWQEHAEEPEVTGETSTCDPSCTEGVTSSDSSSCSEVGFWKNGIWQPRARTPQEARQHRGGSGPQRMMRKQLRMDRYMQGTWRPAWLERYIEDKKRREDTAPGHDAPPESTPVSSSAPPETSHLTDPDPWGARSRDGDDSWWSSSSWSTSWNSSWLCTSWSWTTSSTTTMEPVLQEQEDFPPNYGLLPDVGPALPPTPPNPWLLQLTGAERRLLQEAGVPELRVERIDLLLECLEDHQAADHGPEARWALARLVRRLEDAQASLQVVLEVLARRLRPRGYLPVTRVPHARAEQVRLLTWMINSAAFVTETLEFHLRTPLQPDETTLAAGPRASPPASPVRGLDDEQAASSADGEAAASSSSPHGIVMSSNASCRSRSRSPPPRLPDNTLDYTMGADAFGLDICLLPTERDDEDMDVPLSSVPEGIQRALDGELLGIWLEPNDTEDAVATSSSTQSASTTSTTLTSASTSMWTSLTTPCTTPWTPSPSMTTTSVWTSLTTLCTTPWTPSSSTTTTSSLTTLHESSLGPSSRMQENTSGPASSTSPGPWGDLFSSLPSSPSSSTWPCTAWGPRSGVALVCLSSESRLWTSTTTSTSRTSLDVIGNSTADLMSLATARLTSWCLPTLRML